MHYFKFRYAQQISILRGTFVCTWHYLSKRYIHLLVVLMERQEIMLSKDQFRPHEMRFFCIKLNRPCRQLLWVLYTSLGHKVVVSVTEIASCSVRAWGLHMYKYKAIIARLSLPYSVRTSAMQYMNQRAMLQAHFPREGAKRRCDMIWWEGDQRDWTQGVMRDVTVHHQRHEPSTVALGPAFLLPSFLLVVATLFFLWDPLLPDSTINTLLFTRSFFLPFSFLLLLLLLFLPFNPPSSLSLLSLLDPICQKDPMLDLIYF